MSLQRMVILGTAIGMLLLGLWSGLLRLGWQFPLTDIGAAHGPLMVCGFLGTLIGLERAIALSAQLKKFPELPCGLQAAGD